MVGKTVTFWHIYKTITETYIKSKISNFLHTFVSYSHQSLVVIRCKKIDSLHKPKWWAHLVKAGIVISMYILVFMKT